ncbi:LysR family transcriptional regulator [Actinoallomurus iriomotensis]|uniref:LysR family transcriptional regulator n=1 Tax=Actinoallomurus iriomotensis TaxID=478107 RepID=A0A9W6VIB5_9ACTN|nr:LysR family transcriptional regulator [Actinoallomurus iriomotensis]
MSAYNHQVELREAEIFLVLAEELHFGRTAERLYLTQPRVSQTLRTLEERIGGRLVERTTRRVRLTPLGERLRDELIPAQEQFRRAIRITTDLAKGVSGVLRICLPTYSMAGPSFTGIVRTFKNRYPDCQVTVTEDFPGDLALLRKGTYDLMCHRVPTDEPGLSVGPIMSVDDRILLVHTGHPLAERGHATVEDLADYAVISRSGIPKPTYDESYPATTPSGRPIRRGPEITMSSDVLQLVARGEVVHPTVAPFMDYYRHPDVTQVPLYGQPPVKSVLVWATARENAAIRAFTAMATDLLEHPADTTTSG